MRTKLNLRRWAIAGAIAGFATSIYGAFQLSEGVAFLSFFVVFTTLGVSAQFVAAAALTNWMFRRLRRK